MGKFINTNFSDAVNNVTETVRTFLNNPYYLFNDKKPTLVTYYNINGEKSTLDEGARINYSDLGDNCPLRYNRITDFVVYGIDRIALSLENGEFGLESGEITGDVVILPGTIEPYPGDYFSIDHAKDSNWLFRINDVQKDTLDNGANIWKCGYKLEHDDNTDILPLVTDDYKLLINNIGTKYNTILESKKYDLLDAMDHICTTLKQYYTSLFYDQRVQTFIFVNYGEDHFYDPYMIEFLIRNRILDNGVHNDYIYIDHKIETKRTFALDYNRTFFKAVEDRDINSLIKCKTDSTADYIDEFGSIFNSRADDYWQMNYFVPSVDPTPQPYQFHNVMNCFPKDLIIDCKDNHLYTQPEIDANWELGWYNIITKHFNHTVLDETDYAHLEECEFSDNIRAFYFIPLIIFAIETYERELLMTSPYKNISLNKKAS